LPVFVKTKHGAHRHRTYPATPSYTYPFLPEPSPLASVVYQYDSV